MRPFEFVNTRMIFYWQCNAKFKNGQKCTTPHLTEDDIKRRFVMAANRLLSSKNHLTADFETIKKVLYTTTALETRPGRISPPLRWTG